MWSRTILLLAVVTALPRVPSIEYVAFAGALVDVEALGGPVVMIAAGTGMAALLGIVLAIARRRRSGSSIAADEAERRNEATDRRVAAALIRRTLNRRGRPHFDDDATPAPGRPSESPMARRMRRTD
jgi:hypothetical protein